jgi:hypothetical protein
MLQLRYLTHTPATSALNTSVCFRAKTSENKRLCRLFASNGAFSTTNIINWRQSRLYQQTNGTYFLNSTQHLANETRAKWTYL